MQRRLGLLDLPLVVLVVLLAWDRTPAGGLVDGLISRVTEREARSLAGYFTTAPLSDETAQADARRVLPERPPPEGGLPEPWRTALRLSLDDDTDEEATLSLVDAAYTGDPEAALEVVAVGADARDRAVTRARAAGVPRPEAYLAHRRFLPEPVLDEGDRRVLGVDDLAAALVFVWPTELDARVSSAYGMRHHPVQDRDMFHNGVDLAIPVGTPLHAPADGEVRAVSANERSGTFVVLEHAEGVRTVFCHLESSSVAVGDPVRAGEVFALSGNTGATTGPHLHFTVRVGEQTVDPLWLRPVAAAPPELPAEVPISGA